MIIVVITSAKDHLFAFEILTAFLGNVDRGPQNRRLHFGDALPSRAYPKIRKKSKICLVAKTMEAT